ncbi:MAG: hypothetical protein EOR67_21175 [Mesorhizobium sp.]|nr:MAG: hypothetical protein EOR69_22775 [Mesorhizobium sp.]RWL85944.1 MAG: hypothetical protein EOR67_21175 [Mesorhizobium sp.]RWL93104.1 MAG: hypothetical protein EOR70_29265 [Mesorhizobium sp.]TIP03289.1 MAG: hypothetical protein E5X72_16620 [Mesorhizobium sp.]TJV68774.1 MAG: hypothetical protein E5X76_27515 [Mesorhizobium sp.]
MWPGWTRGRRGEGRRGRKPEASRFFAPLSALPGISPSSGLKWGDRMPRRLSLIANVTRGAPALKLPISPLEGEMSGRTEGGLAPAP